MYYLNQLETIAKADSTVITNGREGATMLGNQEVPQGTEVSRNLQREIEFIFNTNLTTESKTQTVVGAIAKLSARSNVPVQTIGDGEAPVVHTRQMEIAVGVLGETEVDLKTVAAKTLLIREFSTITTTTAKTETNSITLRICGKTHSYYCS